MRSPGIVLVFVSAVVACGDPQPATDAGTGDAAVDDAPVDAPYLPATLADTGLCANADCSELAPGVQAYRPQHELYTDGATKRRWIYLPPGTTIDTSDMNHWTFPVGTKLWKEFTRDGVRIETRFITKRLPDDDAPGAWFFASYQWDLDATQATLADPTSGVENANGTAHDIPRRAHCRECHEGVPGRVLGFEPMSLDYDAPEGSLDLADLANGNLLSAPPSAPAGDGPYFPVPGTDVERAAFGYLHANCSTCHNPTAGNFGHTPLDLRLDVTKLRAVAEVPAHATTVGVAGSVGGPAYAGPIVDPGNPDGSVLILRMNAPDEPAKMPKLGTEIVDPVGQSVLRTWIESL